MLKVPLHSIINSPEDISSSPDKAGLFSSIFASNSTLDEKGDHLHDFPRFTEHNLGNIFITARKFSRFIKSPKKTTDQEKSQWLSLIINPELFPILAKLFKRCSEEKSLPSLWKFQTYSLFSRMRVSSHFPHSRDPTVSSMSLVNSFKL